MIMMANKDDYPTFGFVRSHCRRLLCSALQRDSSAAATRKTNRTRRDYNSSVHIGNERTRRRVAIDVPRI